MSPKQIHAANHAKHGQITAQITVITQRSKALVNKSRHKYMKYTFRSRFAGSFRNPRNGSWIGAI
jgi:hypothetical protein